MSQPDSNLILIQDFKKVLYISLAALIFLRLTRRVRFKIETNKINWHISCNLIRFHETVDSTAQSSALCADFIFLFPLFCAFPLSVTQWPSNLQ